MAHKLLLADDSVTIQRVIELTFADEDVEVTTVGDGQLAIERLDADPPDIVLADVDMPKRDGYEVAAYVRSRPQLAHIPVVLLTGAFEPIDQARAAAAGSTDVLAKPFEPQMVINRVKELLAKKRPKDGAGYVAAYDHRPTREPVLPAPAVSSMPLQDEHMDGPPRTPGAEPVSLDDYFDQLDAAFSRLQPGAPMAEHGTAAEPDWPLQSGARPSVGETPLKQSEAWQPSQTPAAGARPIPPPVAARPAPIQPAEHLMTPPAAPPASQREWRPDPVVSSSRPLPPTAPMPPPRPPVPPPVVARPTAPVAPRAPIAPGVPVAPVAQTAPRAPVAPAFAPQSGASPFDPAQGAPSVNRGAARQAPSAPTTPYAPVPPVEPTRPAPFDSAQGAPSASRGASNPFATLSAAKAEAAAAALRPVITEEVIEEVVARVLERLSDRVVRETVTDIVSRTAERLVQEEIDRIKTNGQ
jgi:CheY-like chemotaxis protein